MIDIQCDIAIMGGRKVSRPYWVGFSPKASGFYPFGDATALLRGRWQKAVFYVFVSVPQYLSTEQGIAHIESKKREGRGASPFLDVLGL